MDLTLGVALLAGLISFLSPCVLPVVPAYLGQLGAVVARSGEAAVVAHGARGEQQLPGRGSRRRDHGQRAGPGQPPLSWVAAHGLAALPNAVAFVLGFGTVFTLVGLTLSARPVAAPRVPAAAPADRRHPAHHPGPQPDGRAAAQRLAGSWRPLDRLVSFRPAGPRRGITGGLVLGAVFAVGWTPCIGPTLGAILTMAAVGCARPRRPRCSSPTRWGWASRSCCWRWPPTGRRPSPDRCSATGTPSRSSVVDSWSSWAWPSCSTGCPWFSNAFVAFWPQV